MSLFPVLTNTRIDGVSDVEDTCWKTRANECEAPGLGSLGLPHAAFFVQMSICLGRPEAIQRKENNLGVSDHARKTSLFTLATTWRHIKLYTIEYNQASLSYWYPQQHLKYLWERKNIRSKHLQLQLNIPSLHFTPSGQFTSHHRRCKQQDNNKSTSYNREQKQVCLSKHNSLHFTRLFEPAVLRQRLTPLISSWCSSSGEGTPHVSAHHDTTGFDVEITGNQRFTLTRTYTSECTCSSLMNYSLYCFSRTGLTPCTRDLFGDVKSVGAICQHGRNSVPSCRTMLCTGRRTAVATWFSCRCDISDGFFQPHPVVARSLPANKTQRE